MLVSPRIRVVCWSGLLGALAVVTSCSGGKLEVIDLNRVLEIFNRLTSREPDDVPVGAPGAAPVVEVQEQDPTRTDDFLQEFEYELNDAKLVESRVGVRFGEDASIEGFSDGDFDGNRGSGEQLLFTIDIDPQGERVIASSEVRGETYRRDHSYRPYYGRNRGWFLWYMLGRNRTTTRRGCTVDHCSVAGR